MSYVFSRKAALPLLLLALGSCRDDELGGAATFHTIEEESFGQRWKSNVLFLVDKSGSMLNPVNPKNPACVGSNDEVCGWENQACDPAVCPTRWSELQKAMVEFLGTNPTLAQTGLMVFPHPDAKMCEPPTMEREGGLLVDLPEKANDSNEQLTASSNAVASALLEVKPGGGTPTAAALRALDSYTRLTADQSRRGFVVLVTDGFPNCNLTNPADADVPGSGCICTMVSCQSTPTTVNAFHRSGCMDHQETLKALRQLRDRGIRTVVVGFGSELEGETGKLALNAMADAGGFVRTCTSGRTCGEDTCGADGLCPRRFFLATSASQLKDALTTIQGTVEGNPCAFELKEAPRDTHALFVFVEGERLESGPDTWTYGMVDGAPTVTLQGKLCERVLKATPENAVTVKLQAGT